MADEFNTNEISDQLFAAIDAIVKQRIKQLDYDKTIIATIINNENRFFGRYQVTTDNNIQFTAYSEITTYEIGDKVYIRVPGSDYTKQKVITSRYIESNRNKSIPELQSVTINNLSKLVNNLIKNDTRNKNLTILQIVLALLNINIIIENNSIQNKAEIINTLQVLRNSKVIEVIDDSNKEFDIQQKLADVAYKYIIEYKESIDE